MTAEPASPLRVRPARAGDIEAYAATIGKPMVLPTVIAWAGEIDGRVVAIGGVAIAGGRHRAFIDLQPEARPWKMTIARSALRALSHLKALGVRYIYAEPDPDEPGAQRWLASLGFRPDQRSNGALYRWQHFQR